MPLLHRDPAADSHIKGIVDNTIHNCIRNRAVTLGSGLILLYLPMRSY